MIPPGSEAAASFEETKTIREMTAPIPSPNPKVTIAGLLETVAVVLMAATLAGFLGRLWWILELPTHFRPHLAFLLGVSSAIWLIRRRRRLALACCVFAAINITPVLALLWPDAAAKSDTGVQLRVISLNVHTSNQHSDLVLDCLRNAHADVILLMEVDDRWMSAMEPLRTAYLHTISEPRDDNFGVALFSRLPLTNSNVIALGDTEVPSIETTVTISGHQFHLLGTHPLPPATSEYAQSRNEQFRQIAAHVRKQTLPTVVIGDLNATPWSPYFNELRQESGLKNSSQGRGLSGSWPAWLPLGRIILDHCLISPSIQTIGRRLGPQVGSDHLPLIVDLQMPAK